jgi:hypothetical protein
VIGSVSEFQQQLAAQQAAIGRRRKDHTREPMTPAHAADEAAMEAACAGEGHCDSRPLTGEDARKAIEAQRGPGTFREPGPISPEDFRRDYLDAGHAAPSPLHQPPRDFPVPEGQPAAEDFTRGYLQPGHAAASPAARDSGMPQHQLSGSLAVHGTGPAAAGIAAHMARYSMTSPSLRGGQ